MNSNARKQLIQMALRRAKPGSGSRLSELREIRAGYGRDPAVPDGLDDIRYVIVGGHATTRYMPQRMTNDTDILISVEDLSQAEHCLDSAGCARTGPLAVGGSSWRLPNGGQLDVLALDRPWVPDAIEAAEYDDQGRPFVGLPHLVLMKLESGRLQDLADISRMLGFADDAAVDHVRRVISRYRPDDLDDVENMLHLGRLEHFEDMQ